MSYEHCISGYTNFNENIHYFYQFAYLFTAICINYRILYVIWVSQRHFYRNQSFYNLYSVDCFTSVLAMSNELIFTRSFLYFPQLCVSFSEIVKNSPVFMRIYYCLLSYLIAIKPVIHIFIAVNRMSCVMFPVTYSQNWSQKLRIMLIVIFLAPFLVIWNVLISDNFIGYVNGGFGISYTRRVTWASLSLMQFTLIILTVLITMVTTTVTFYKMTTMKKRIKASERALCIAAALISVGFLLEAITQSFFAFFKEAPWLLDVMNYLRFATMDILFVGSPLVLLLVSDQFRGHVLGSRIGRTQRVSSINNTHSHIHHNTHHTMTRYSYFLWNVNK
ncbi:Serpentine receptor class gamma-3 [Caenorhabditis elegans]|uniref:Serpentine receptor class gamma-3 n=1 Tax=Caenorhabditis elegans TaxID=6239 RepID=SRG3_CAEEL|nr:Serpentine receptor class gamma-3 [Caenorhabditis elegans]P46572.1 RecName: Full=Serpentine receptor class gamma-3; Short=Protein srg-3 [Caenorhabditis elegans]CCD65203.1 Serpentine receptor class gamma-3 [Caenorhabditis elegans]|eukprot:NP_498372.1 Serpentine receptor class gamma-3 [Caenorhabditis elegans]